MFHVTFKLRSIVLLMVVLTSILPGSFVTRMPLYVGYGFALIFIPLACASIVFTMNYVSESIVISVKKARYDKQHKATKKYYSYLDKTALRLGIPTGRPINVTDNPNVKGPFTNFFTNAITYPSAWINEFQYSEILGSAAHEQAHIKRKKQYVAELIIGSILSLCYAIILSLFTIPAIAQVSEIALFFLILTHVSWRNEYAADLDAAIAIGNPEWLVSVLDRMREEQVLKMKKDEGSETHPPMSSRIARLVMKMHQESARNQPLIHPLAPDLIGHSSN